MTALYVTELLNMQINNDTEKKQYVFLLLIYIIA